MLASVLRKAWRWCLKHQRSRIRYEVTFFHHIAIWQVKGFALKTPFQRRHIAYQHKAFPVNPPKTESVVERFVTDINEPWVPERTLDSSVPCTRSLTSKHTADGQRGFWSTFLLPGLQDTGAHSPCSLHSPHVHSRTQYIVRYITQDTLQFWSNPNPNVRSRTEQKERDMKVAIAYLKWMPLYILQMMVHCQRPLDCDETLCCLHHFQQTYWDVVLSL